MAAHVHVGLVMYVHLKFIAVLVDEHTCHMHVHVPVHSILLCHSIRGYTCMCMELQTTDQRYSIVIYCV